MVPSEGDELFEPLLSSTSSFRDPEPDVFEDLIRSDRLGSLETSLPAGKENLRRSHSNASCTSSVVHFTQKSQFSFNPASQLHPDDSMAGILPYFDTDDHSLRYLFERIVKRAGNTQYLSLEEFREALEQIGLDCEDEYFDAFTRDEPEWQEEGLRFEGFRQVVRKIKSHMLFNRAMVRQLGIPISNCSKHKFTVHDYDRGTVDKRHFTDDFAEELESFMINQRPIGGKYSVRWIEVDGNDELNLKRIAMKYDMHPLALQDALSKPQRPILNEHCKDNFFFVFPCITMDSYASSCHSDIEKDLNQKPQRAQLRRMKSNIGRSEPKRANPELNTPKFNDKIIFETIAIFFQPERQVLVTIGGKRTRYHHIVWDTVRRRIENPYSKARAMGSDYLLYLVLHSVVDHMAFVLDRHDELLAELTIELDIAIRKNGPISEPAQVMQLKHVLKTLPPMLKPAKELLPRILTSKFIDPCTKAYVRDVIDKFEQVFDECQSLLVSVQLLSDGYAEANQQKINMVGHNLTVIATVFMPCSFLTGVYGMNFADMPELQWRYGYLLFWLTCLFILGLSQWYVRKTKFLLDVNLENNLNSRGSQPSVRHE